MGASRGGAGISNAAFVSPLLLLLLGSAVLRGETCVSSLSDLVLGTVARGVPSWLAIACANAVAGTEYGWSMQYCSNLFSLALSKSLLSSLLHEILNLFAHTPQLSSLFTSGKEGMACIECIGTVEVDQLRFVQLLQAICLNLCQVL